jgi:hypothetical protein
MTPCVLVRVTLSDFKVMYAEHANQGGQQADCCSEHQYSEQESEGSLIQMHIVLLPFAYISTRHHCAATQQNSTLA